MACHLVDPTLVIITFFQISLLFFNFSDSFYFLEFYNTFPCSEISFLPYFNIIVKFLYSLFFFLRRFFFKITSGDYNFETYSIYSSIRWIKPQKFYLLAKIIYFIIFFRIVSSSPKPVLPTKWTIHGVWIQGYISQLWLVKTST